ncbi:MULTISPECIES: peptidoglycan recognition family protein [Actinoalloteichus]|uniref:N-acetylmuramoyl-L-alanine amidase n=1 Tax=Actinoalloteichus fjordicus TaxID=1612552 RepID=A0AAC9LIH5_9PSEU|nr:MULTISPECIES: peptidoglycan recognition family protein [Actinoalloteichus]APU16960.1 N-acetylmuramoyl-L-alanine amidase [Actinoalloteichus fjordicus]APU23040.1 N-acetylmuramoyl-L-alanine amidase [Actinoalloteichus sp. GBA129-24]
MPTRREMLTAALSVGAWMVVGSPGAAFAAAPVTAAPIGGAPDAQTSGTGLEPDSDAVIRPEAFDHVGVLFPADAGTRIDESGRTTIGRVRFETNGRLGPWQALRPSAEAPDHVPASASDLVLAPSGATGFQVEIDDGVGPFEPVAVLAGPAAADTSAPRLLPMPGATLQAISRAGWGADESLRTWPATFNPVQCLTVHHSAIELEADRTASVRAIYRFHAVDRAWGDLGYHLLIDPEGQVYEGRFSGSDTMPVFDGIPSVGAARSVLAGHVGSHNAGNIGVCLLGDFTVEPPAEAAVDALVETLAALCLLCGLDPTGTTHYASPTGDASRTVPTISGHRDWSVTQCPGDVFAPTLDEIRTRVAALVG